MAKSLIIGQAMLKDKTSDRSFVYTPRELVEKCRPDNLYLISFDEYSAADPFDDTYR